jgi:hypothetical protein
MSLSASYLSYALATGALVVEYNGTIEECIMKSVGGEQLPSEVNIRRKVRNGVIVATTSLTRC